MTWAISCGNERTTSWTDASGAARSETLTIDTQFARHAVHGVTSIDARTRKRDGDGALLKDMRKHYDGAPFDGLPLGEITHGFRTRQTEVALTAREITLAYDGVAPPVIAAGTAHRNRSGTRRGARARRRAGTGRRRGQRDRGD